MALLAFSYEIATRDRAGRDHVRRHATDEPLAPGSIVSLADRPWLVVSVDGARVEAVPARYRLALRHLDGREEAGVFRRFRPDAPLAGHQLTTLEDGAQVSWTVVEQRLASDDAGEPFLELVAERDRGEAESLPDHQLEHALEQERDGDGAAQLLAQAAAPGVAVELVALEAGRAADWDAAARFLDALTLDEVGEDLLALCGVDPGHEPRETWLDRVRERLAADLESFRRDVEGGHDEIEEWDFRGGRIFAAVGSVDDESNPLSGYGWLCRLVDADALGAAGFRRVRRAELA